MASAHSLAGLMKFLDRAEWQDGFSDVLAQHLAQPCKNAGITIDELADLIEEHHASVLWGCAFEDFLTCDLDDGRNIAEDYLKRRGWKESASNKAYISALRSSVMSLYEISDIVPDESFLARDLVQGGEPVRVSERSGTRYLKPWDRMAARLVRVGPRIEMAGGVLRFDYDTSEDLLDTLRRTKEALHAELRKSARKHMQGIDSAALSDALSDTAFLHASAFLFTNVWLDDLLQRALNPTSPQMFNTDGDEILFTTASFPLQPQASADAVRLSLAAVPELRPENETFWNWIGAKERTGKKRQAAGRTFITTLEDGSLVHGTLEMKAGLLVLEANSPQRAERGRAMIERALGTLIGEPVIETRTLAQLMASRPDKTSEASSSGLSPEEERAALQDSMDSYYMDLLDEKVPMLGNMTPRRAAKSEKGRAKLVAWLKLLENGASKHGGSSAIDCDLSWIWTELGVAHLRR